MAVRSKFFQLTGQVMLEYKTDQYVILRNDNGNMEDYIMYQGVDNNQYCLLMNSSSLSHALYQESDKSTQFYGGINSSIDEANDNTNYPYGHDIYVENTDFYIGSLIEDASGNSHRRSQLYCDTIRLYLLTGYVMNNIGGYSIKVKGKVINTSAAIDPTDPESDILVNRVDDYIYLLNWYMPKEELKNNIQWLSTPLYLNSKFYDRYIEIKLPSAQDIAVNHRNIDYIYRYVDDENTYYLRGTIDKFSNLIIEFATVQQSNIILENKYDSLGPSSFILDVSKVMSIYPESNANNIGIKLYEDVNTHSIIYYPTYGDGLNVEPLNLEIMAKIDDGEIPLINYSEYDSANDGMDEFIEMYGNGDINSIPCKWIVINELAVTYNYARILNTNQSNNATEESYTDFFTNTIDYTDKKLEDGDFYITKFVPYIKERLNMNCKSIVIQYNCHLYNRMNNIDIVRSASMVISNPYKYVLTQIDTKNVINYKIVNKMEKSNINVSIPNQESVNQKIIKEFYDVTELVASTGNDGIYEQGKLTLYLNHSGSNYLIKLYSINSDNVRVPYDLSGPWKYKLVFPTISGDTIDILANLDNDKTNYGNGSLSFYISKDKASAIMSVPASERYFSLMIDNKETESSVIYEGNVEWKV